MELNLKTRYDIGDEVIIDSSSIGIVVGIHIAISQPQGGIGDFVLADKTYLIDINDEIIEIEEELLKHGKISNG